MDRRRTSEIRWPQLLALGLLAVGLGLFLPAHAETGSYLVGSDGDERITRGFWARERNERERYRWTDGDSMLRFAGYEAAEGAAVSLRLIGPQGPTGQSTTLSLRTSAGEVQAQPQATWRRYHLLVPSLEGRWQAPALQLFSPPVSAGADSRPLGVALSDVQVARVGNRRPVALGERALFYLVVLALIWLALRGRAGRLALPATALAGLALGAAARLRPELSGYYLPQLWSLALALLALAACRWLAPRLAARVRSRRWLALGLTLGLTGQLLLRAQLLPALGGLLLIGGALIAAVAVGEFQVSGFRFQGDRRLDGTTSHLRSEAAIGPWPGDTTHAPADAAVSTSRRDVSTRAATTALRSPIRSVRSIRSRIRSVRSIRSQNPLTAIRSHNPLTALLLLALGLRLYQLDAIPFGMWRDEARHGLLALQILDSPGFRPIYVPNEIDLPALLFYLQGLAIRLLGPTVLAARAIPAVFGSLTVLPAYALGRQLYGRWVGLAAAFLVAVASWHVALSRFASPAILDPFFTLTALALLWRSTSPDAPRWQRLGAGLAAGLSLGLTLYTYHTGRLMPLMAAALVAYRLGARPGAWRRAAPALALFALAGLLTALPLLSYMRSSPESFNERLETIGLLAADEEHPTPAFALQHNITRYLLMWNVEGERNARHHVPYVPLLDLFSGLLFAVGALLALLGRAGSQGRLLLALLLIGLLPGLLSSNAPHALRSVDAIVPGLLLAALGAWRGAQALGLARASVALPPGRAGQSSGAHDGSRRPWPAAAVLLGATAIAAFNIWVYFGHTPYDPRIWSKFAYLEETAIGSYARHSAEGGPLFVSDAVARNDVARYLLYGLPVTTFDPQAPPRALPHGARLLVQAEGGVEQPRLGGRGLLKGATPQPMRPYPGTERPTFWLYNIP